MATGIGKWFGQAVISFVGGSLESENRRTDFLSNDMRLALLDAVPDQNTAKVWADIADTEIEGPGYTPGGQALTNKTLGFSSATRVTKFDADDVAWDNATISATAAAIYDNSPAADGDKILYGFIDFQGVRSSDTNEFRIQFDPAGLLTSTAS